MGGRAKKEMKEKVKEGGRIWLEGGGGCSGVPFFLSPSISSLLFLPTLSSSNP